MYHIVGNEFDAKHDQAEGQNRRFDNVRYDDLKERSAWSFLAYCEKGRGAPLSLPSLDCLYLIAGTY